MMIDILVKLQENTLLRQASIRNSSALVPRNIVDKSGNCPIRFKELADNVHALNKILLKHQTTLRFNLMIFCNWKSMNAGAFLKFDYKKDCLDKFIWPFLMRMSD